MKVFCAPGHNKTGTRNHREKGKEADEDESQSSCNGYCGRHGGGGNRFCNGSQLLPQDLLKFGLIPEFIGRLPIVATLQELDRNALIEILKEPKNSLIKQYQKLFEIDGVELIFEEDALGAIVDKAIERKTGARGLRSIIEERMRDIMFDIPSNPNIEKCVITKRTIIDNEAPDIVVNNNKQQKRKKKKRQVPEGEEKETA